MWFLSTHPLASTGACLCQGQLELARRYGTEDSPRVKCQNLLTRAKGWACLHELFSQQRCPSLSKCLEVCIITELLQCGNSQPFSSAFTGSCKLQFEFSAEPSEHKVLHQQLMLAPAADQRLHLQISKAQQTFISCAVYGCHLTSQVLTSKYIFASM